MMRKFEVKPLPGYLRAADHLMKPLMWLLGRCRADSIQETHPWHAQPISPETIDLSMAIYTPGRDPSTHTNQKSFLFHAPIFGGWKEYTVYDVERQHMPFYIGWIALNDTTRELKEAAIHRLPIHDSRIRTLDGPIGHAAYFFAINEVGDQVPLHVADHGHLGDSRHSEIRLF